MPYCVMDTPVGHLRIDAEPDAITGVNRTTMPLCKATTPLLQECVRQLTAYFAGELTEFHLPLRAVGTPFRMRVWEELRRIPYGETISYGELARRIGKPSASRAVGGANHHNPISIIIPCHRVIGADGSLTGYGGGMDMKAALLLLENSHPE